MLQTPTANLVTSSEKRFDRSSWITLAIGLVILALGAAVTAASYSMPADGWLVDRGISIRYTNPVYVTGLPDTNPDLKPGDVLLEVEGESFELLEARAAALRPQRPANWELGEKVQYTVLRDGSEVVVPITLVRPPLALVLSPSNLLDNGFLLASSVYMLMGGLLFLVRPRERAPQLLFVGAILLFVGPLADWGIGAPPGVADLFSVAAYWPRIIMNLSWVLIWPILAHLFLIFPVPKRPVRRSSLVIPLVFGIPVAALLVQILVVGLGVDDPGLLVPVIYNLLYLAIIALSLVHSLITIKEPVPRMQMRWIAFGGLVGIVGMMIVAMADEVRRASIPASSGDPASSGLWFGLTLFVISSAFPISLVIAILRYRLWDIDIIINRSLVYGSLTGVLAFIYFGSVVILETFFSAVTEQGSPLTIVISTLVIAALFSPLRSRVQQLIDRRFYRRKYDAQRILGEFAISARSEPDLDRLTAEFLRVAQSAMQAEHVSIWLREPAGTERTHKRLRETRVQNS